MKKRIVSLFLMLLLMTSVVDIQGAEYDDTQEIKDLTDKIFESYESIGVLQENNNEEELFINNEEETVIKSKALLKDIAHSIDIENRAIDKIEEKDGLAKVTVTIDGKQYYIFMVKSTDWQVMSISENDGSENANIVSQDDVQKIEEKLDELDVLNAEKTKIITELDNHSNTEFQKKLQSIEESIEDIKKELVELGAEEPSDEKLIEVLFDGVEEQNISIYSDFHPFEIVQSFRNTYQMYRYQESYSGQTYYTVNFGYKDGAPYLYNNLDGTIYDTADFTDSQSMAERVLRIYEEKLVGEGVNAVLDKIPIIRFLPYELFLDALNREGHSYDITNLRLNSTTILSDTTERIKFVYHNDGYGWRERAVANKVYVTNGLTYRWSDAERNGQVYYGYPVDSRGAYDDALDLARLGVINNRTIIRNINYYDVDHIYEGHGLFRIYMHAPREVRDML
ncbi:hypothetical protein EDC19_1505 [Natranaerovirga hydrolytica]|uniref:Uncharacterized protein n=1 Tax=Natranaerovirga hydrolytica TaxID=680378 RepID=A0A4R1MTL7_9FIRM|nr:hypothetical protein [Natranaerovirga hydrolytica]TCK93313.1 hypothetical protein EDC19_1505 [Natranaerovirga hydrolytica]